MMLKKTTSPLGLPIQPSKEDPRPLVVYHGRNCPDGFAAALAAWLFYEGQAEFLGLDHGDIKTVADLPALDGRAVYILDFSFSKSILRNIEQRRIRRRGAPAAGVLRPPGHSRRASRCYQWPPFDFGRPAVRGLCTSPAPDCP